MVNITYFNYRSSLVWNKEARNIGSDLGAAMKVLRNRHEKTPPQKRISTIIIKKHKLCLILVSGIILFIPSCTFRTWS